MHFARPVRETLISNLPTNGKVEPIEWSAVRVNAPGLVAKLAVQQGDKIAKGALLAQISEPGLAEQVSAAQARVALAQNELDVLNKGGRSSELSDIESRLSRAQFDRDQANREWNSLRRLSEKNPPAATILEVEGARTRVRQAELQIESLQKQRTNLVSKVDISSSQARLRESQAGAQAAVAKLGQGMIRSPIAGVVYNLPARQGSYLNPGDLVAEIGQLDRLRVRVYVDEPELGRVAVGQPVKITWEALPSRSWQGTVERMPTQIIALGTRQVGEVLCTIDNPGHELVPGTNVDANIETSLVPGALTVPKEAVRRDGGVYNVYVLTNGDVIRRRKVEAGSSSITRTQIKSGLQDNEAVALPSDHVLKDGERVTPIYQ